MIGNIDNLLNFTNDIFQKKELKPVMNEVAQIAGHLWERGWAERNAGNFSINVTGLFQEKELDRLSTYPFLPLKKAYPELARTLFLISGTGTRMRDMAKNPAEFVCFVYISDSGSAFHVIARGNGEQSPGSISPVNPTSEMATHLAIQQMFLHRKSPEKVVLHAHVTELIALTQLPGFKSEQSINSMIWGMHPETVTYVPDGAGFIPYALAGTEKIALSTLRELEKHRSIVWEKHGGIAVGKTLGEAFDILDLLAKAAKIYFLCKSAGMEPEGLTPEQLQEIRDFHAR